MDNNIKTALFSIGFIGLALGILGLLYPGRIGDVLLNLGTEMIGIVITVAIINRIYDQGTKEALKAKLIRQMGSQDNASALQAVTELDAHGWVQDGSLTKQSFYKANLSEAHLNNALLEECVFTETNFQKTALFGANLRGARFQGTNLSEARLVRADLQGAYFFNSIVENTIMQRINLKETSISDEQLASVLSLMAATMPNGERYNGRFRLQADMEAFHGRYGQESDENWANFYGVSVEEYRTGQRWADKNLNNVSKNWIMS